MKTPVFRYTLCFILLVVLSAVLLVWNIGAGSVAFTPCELIAALLGPPDQGILWGIRLPRILAAALLGGALAVSGFLLQTFFANPIAGPFVLGISSGAKLAVSLVMVALFSRGIAIHSLTLVAGAFLGSMLSMGIILLLSRQVRQQGLLVVSGVMIGYICSAITDFVVTFADDSNIVNLHNWSQGSFSGTSWDDVRLMTWVVAPALALAFLLSKPIGAYQLGEVYAQNMGVNIRRFRVALILLSSILSACVTAFAGPISFVGVAVPHLMKGLFRTAKPLLILPACFLGGGAFCLFCDLIARTAFAPRDMSISSVTAVFGAPIVLYLMAARRGRGGTA
ncbi:MAG: iron ABC transporter permease [Oscillospiraceae bacterium]|nr:iron ABC transporter permease [Oscillospiraceae bacterium]